MPSPVTITTGARLHFGLLANAPGRGRRFGGAGLMIDRPGFTLTATASDVDAVEGPEAFIPDAAKIGTFRHTDYRDQKRLIRGRGEYKPRIEHFVKAYRSGNRAGGNPLPCRLELKQSIPAHAGLGSGTQLGMAVAQALAIVSNEGHVGVAELAGRVGRGLRSALGIHGFERGGFLVEAGKRGQNGIGPLVARAHFPDEWRMLLIRPREFVGLSGDAEVAAFAKLEPMAAEITARLCALLVTELLPAILEADFDACSEALFTFGGIVGGYFAPVQHGIYASPEMSLLADHLRSQGVQGVGQTSWGPTLFALCQGERQAMDLAADLEASRWGSCERTIAAPLNTGAAIEVGR